jgi:hypothetical protein
MKEIVHGNKVFSDDKINKSKADFQTEHMKNKIKNVKKKKRFLNIQNIEPLVNIHEMPEDNRKEPIIEGLNLNPITTFKDDEWTGGDEIYEGGDKAELKLESFADIIERFYKKLNDKYDKFIYNVTKFLSGNAFFNSDVPHVKKYFNWMLSIIVASIAVYNWVFLMFFKYNHSKDNEGTKVPVWKTPRDYIHNHIVLSPFYHILDKFTNIPLFFPEYLKIGLITWFPDFITRMIDKNGTSKIVLILLFICILVLATFMVNGSGEYIKNIIVDIVTFELNGIFTMFIYIVTFVLFILTFVDTDNSTSIIDPLKRIIGPFTLFAKVFNPLFWIEKIVILIYLVFLGAPIATALCLCYILAYTFGGIPLYKDGKSIMEIKQLIDEFFDVYKPEPRRDTPCNPLSFFEKIINYMVRIFNYIYENCIKLGFVIVMLYALIDSGINIKSNPLKVVTMLISISSIILVFMYGILSFIKGEQVNENVTAMANNIKPVMEPIKETINPLADTNISNIMEKINTNDNDKIKEGLKQGLDILSNNRI